MHDRLNILWFCADQMRYDTVHALGNPHINTPNLDRLVASGVAFTRTYAQNTVCTPSRASFLTGRYPAAHRVYRNGVESFPDDEVLVTRLFADAVYEALLVNCTCRRRPGSKSDRMTAMAGFSGLTLRHRAKRTSIMPITTG